MAALPRSRRAFLLLVPTFLALAALVLVWSSRVAASAQTPVRPIVVQGAMDIEIRKLAGRLEHPVDESMQGWLIWRGTIDDYPVVISKTLKGMENAAAATALVADRYHPAAIINQGTSGGHTPSVHVFDIVLGVESVNLSAFKTGTRAPGAGSDVREWVPLDLMKREGSAGQDPQEQKIRRFPGDAGLLAAAHAARDRYGRGRVVDGVIGSSDMWNSELDRIQWFHDRFGTTTEEMEAAAAAQIAGAYGVPFLGIRILSNNITNDGAYDGTTGEACQDYVFDVVRTWIRSTKAQGR